MALQEDQLLTRIESKTLCACSAVLPDQPIWFQKELPHPPEVNPINPRKMVLACSSCVRGAPASSDHLEEQRQWKANQRKRIRNDLNSPADLKRKIDPVALLKNVKSADETRAIHAAMRSTARSAHCGNLFIQAYGRYGSLKQSEETFARIWNKNSESWSSMMQAYVQNAEPRKAIRLYLKLRFEGEIVVNSSAFSAALEACGNLNAPSEGIAVYAQCAAAGLQQDDSVQRSLLGMHISCGNLESARNVFESRSWIDPCAWNMMLAANAQDGDPHQALRLYWRMLLEGIEIDCSTLVNVLLACSISGDAAQGRIIHTQFQAANKSAHRNWILVENAALSMYCKCGSPDEARELFQSMEIRDVVSWNVMIAACRSENEAIELWNMDLEGVAPNLFTFSAITGLLSAASGGAVEDCRALYERLIESRLERWPVESAFE